MMITKRLPHHQRFRVAAAIAFCLVLASKAQAQPGGCFERLHHNQPKDADYYFDLKFDRLIGGGSFSCDLDVRPSEARRVIDDFRFAVIYQSGVHLRRAVRFPFKVSRFDSLDISSTSRTMEVRNEQEWLNFVKVGLDSNNLALIGCANLRNVTIVKARSYGFTIAAGTVWFQRTPVDSRPRVTSINLTPVPEKALIESCLIK